VGGIGILEEEEEGKEYWDERRKGRIGIEWKMGLEYK
jgi:hypothetical protein